MLTYFFEVTIYWSTFYLFYLLLFSRETFFNGNRIYLLATFSGSLLLPLVDWSGYVSGSGIFEVVLPAIQITSEGLNEPIFTEASNTLFTFLNVLIVIFLLGAILTASRFLTGVIRINRLRNNADRGNIFGMPVLLTSEIQTPFSFFKNLFWSTHLQHLSEKEVQQIILHESAHIRYLHSLDVILTELVTIVFWWNPLTYAFKKAIREVHEFLADEYAIRQTNKQQYGRLLITQSRTFSNLLSVENSPVLGNHFFHSQLKKRIMMMTKKKSAATSSLKYLLVFPLLAVLVFACESVVQNELPEIDEETSRKIAEEGNREVEFQTDTIITFDPETMTETVHYEKSKVYNVVDKMPYFPGCEDEPGGKQAVKKCSDQRMLDYIFKNIKYPEKAKTDGVEGMVVVSFIVGKHGGRVYDPKIRRSVSPECDAEVLRLINNMPPWIAGEHKGKKVNVRFNLPVKFKLE